MAAHRTLPSYRSADRDPQWLQHEESRGIRLELEYVHAERALRSYGVRHTILVLGSTRIGERDGGLARYYAMARAFGRIVGRAGRRTGGIVMTGGGPGLMEAANRGAHDVGAPSAGFNIALPRVQPLNPYVTPQLALRFRYFALRKLHFLLRARALVAFPGGFGTFDELFETLTLVQTRKVKPMPVVLAGSRYWRRAFDMEYLVAQGVVGRRDCRLFCYADSARAIWDAIGRWYATAGETVFPA